MEAPRLSPRLSNNLASMSIASSRTISPPSVPSLGGNNERSSTSFTITHLPKEIFDDVASYLDHASLVHLSATSTSLRNVVVNDMNSTWKTLHDRSWRSGKRLRFGGPPSQIPRSGNGPWSGSVLLGNEVNWQEEFARRFTLDKRVPDLLSRVSDAETDGAFHAEVLMNLEEYGADVYERLKSYCKGANSENQYSEAAKKALVEVNVAEARADWRLYGRLGYEDGMMVISKLFQSVDDLIARSSTDEIYSEINRELDALTVEDLKGFDRAEDTVLLDKVLKNRRGLLPSLVNMAFRVVGTPLPAAIVEWWDSDMVPRLSLVVEHYEGGGIGNPDNLREDEMPGPG